MWRRDRGYGVFTTAQLRTRCMREYPRTLSLPINCSWAADERKYSNLLHIWSVYMYWGGYYRTSNNKSKKNVESSDLNLAILFVWAKQKFVRVSKLFKFLKFCSAPWQTYIRIRLDGNLMRMRILCSIQHHGQKLNVLDAFFFFLPRRTVLAPSLKPEIQGQKLVNAGIFLLVDYVLYGFNSGGPWKPSMILAHW